MKIFTSFCIAVLFCFCSINGKAQSISLKKLQNISEQSTKTATAVVLDSTTLPIVAMKLPFLWPPWDPIPDTPKVTVDMGIVNNGYNVMNHITDPKNGYLGKIGIEKRGSISQAFWYLQKSYGFETRDTLGNNVNAVILGMPKEHDWVLYGPYDDHSLMRNVIIYSLGRDMGYWTPRTKFCEVQFYNWAWTPDYRGVYVMMEKIKRDNNRVNIPKLDLNDNAGDSLTGGYIFAVDKNIWASDSGWKSPKDTGVFFSYKYPKADVITTQQKNYLKQYVDSFETSLKSPGFNNLTTGFRKYSNPTTFMDFFFMQEFSKNIDAYRRSAYLYKNKYSKGGKLNAGPLWDFNSSLYNAKLCTFEQDTGWAYKTVCYLTSNYHIPFWWGRMLQDTNYANELKCRWKQWRATVLDTSHIFRILDSMTNYVKKASVRHFTVFNINTTLKTEVDSLKWWMKKRLKWLDANMPGKCYVIPGVFEKSAFENSLSVYPNPNSGQLNIDFYLSSEKNIKMELFDLYGRILIKNNETQFRTGQNSVQLDLYNYSAGIYFIKVSGEGIAETKKIILQP